MNSQSGLVKPGCEPIMKEEKEIKLIINPDDYKYVIDVLMGGGCKRVETLEVTDIYYDTNGKLRENDEAYRRRIVDEEGALSRNYSYSYKKFENGKVYEEELTREEFSKRTKLFKSLDTIKKVRKVYEVRKMKQPQGRMLMEDVEIVIDNVEGLGLFMEIECKGESDPVEVFESFGFGKTWMERTTAGITKLWFAKHGNGWGG